MLDEPQPPKNLEVTEVWTDYICLSWQPPEDDGGQELLGYIIEKREFDRPIWVKTNNVPASQKPTAKVTGLFEGSEYFFRIFSVNSIGPSKDPTTTKKSYKARIPYGKLIK